MISITIVVLFVFCTDLVRNERLIGTHIIFRHGERTPSYGYGGNSHYDPNVWPNGLGQLTVRGRLQQISLGEYFRERYSNLINSTYVASEIYIRSSDYDRTLMSAYSNLVGLYPTSKRTSFISVDDLQTNNWPETLPWQPIPVHTVPKSIDHLMGVSSCDYYEELVDQMRQTSRIISLNNEFRDLIEYLEKHTNQSIDDIFIAWDIADTVLIEALYNVTPSWATPTILKQLKLLEDLCFYHLVYSDEINRLRGGPFIGDILDNVKRLISKDSRAKKMKLYSGHDLSIASVLAFFKANYVHQPSFASALFFDLYQNDDNSYSVRLEYLNGTNKRSANPIQITGCPTDDQCPLNQFIELYERKIPVQMDKECRSKKLKRLSSRIHRISFSSD